MIRIVEGIGFRAAVHNFVGNDSSGSCLLDSRLWTLLSWTRLWLSDLAVEVVWRGLVAFQHWILRSFGLHQLVLFKTHSQAKAGVWHLKDVLLLLNALKFDLTFIDRQLEFASGDVLAIEEHLDPSPTNCLTLTLDLNHEVCQAVWLNILDVHSLGVPDPAFLGVLGYSSHFL